MRRPRTDIRPPFGSLNANSATMQPLSNSDTDATNRHSTISQTIQQPLSNPAPTIGNLNPSTTVLQPPDGRFRAWQTPTTQPSFGSNTRTTRFRLNLPTSLIRQLQPILKNNSTSTKKLAQDRPFRVLCRRSAAHPPRKDRVAASRSLSCPRRPDQYLRRIGKCSILKSNLKS